MGFLCFERKGDFHKCIPFYIIGAILIVLGLPLMLVGIIASFQSSDLVGYIGGISIIFGLMFMLLWHMFTIKNLDKNTKVKDSKIEKIGKLLRKNSGISMNNHNNGGTVNRAFVKDLPGLKTNQSAPGESLEMKETPNSPNEYEVYGKKSDEYSVIQSDGGGYENLALEQTPDANTTTKSILTVENERRDASMTSHQSSENLQRYYLNALLKFSGLFYFIFQYTGSRDRVQYQQIT